MQFINKQNSSIYDIFLSHASEDKDEVARPLKHILETRGLRVWFDENEVKMGDSLVARLNEGINTSKYGIVVLSKMFFAKQWTIHELDMLEYLWVTENRVIFPIWHNITESEIRSFRASLANRVALCTETHTVAQIANEIHEVVMSFNSQETITDDELEFVSR